MGEAFEGDLVPIMDGRTVVGCVVTSYSVVVKEEMAAITAQFQESVGNTRVLWRNCWAESRICSNC